MNVRVCHGSSWEAFQAGKCKGLVIHHIAQARYERDPKMRELHVKRARRCNHRMIQHLRHIETLPVDA